MPAVPLPENPDLGQLRSQAREFQRAVRAGDSDALAAVAEFYPNAPAAPEFPLSGAQLVTARRYRFESWARLRRHVQIVTARSWNPAPPRDDEPLPDRRCTSPPPAPTWPGCGSSWPPTRRPPHTREGRTAGHPCCTRRTRATILR